MMLQDVAEAFRTGCEGFLQDLRLEARPWSLPLERISCPVRLWHGDADNTVPVTATERLAAQIPNATVSIRAHAGHFFVFDIWSEVLDWLVAQPAASSGVEEGTSLGGGPT